MKYARGQRLYLIINNQAVREVRYVCQQGGRYIVSFAGCSYEREGRICVSQDRLFSTADAAERALGKAEKVSLPKASGDYNWRRETRWDVPGDGWGRR